MYPIQSLTAAVLIRDASSSVIALVGQQSLPTWCLYMHYADGPINRQTLPIYFGPQTVVMRLETLLKDRVLPWHAIQLCEVRRRGRPALPQLGVAEVCPQAVQTEMLIAEVNARFPLLALHVYGISAKKLSEALGVPPVRRKTVTYKYVGMFRQPVPARISRGLKPISVKR